MQFSISPGFRTADGPGAGFAYTPEAQQDTSRCGRPDSRQPSPYGLMLRSGTGKN